MNFDSGTKSGQISRRTSERQGCGTDCVVCIKRESAVLQKPENSTVTRKRLYPTYPPWEELMQDVGKIKLTMNPEKKTLERTWQWLNVAVSPSLKLMDKIGKLDNRDYIRQLIERGQMNEEQQRIYEDYKKSFLLREEERRIFDRTYTEHDTDKESPYSE